MKKIIVFNVIALLISTISADENTHPWIAQWNRVAQEDTHVYTDNLKQTLEATGKKIKDLLVKHANARISKGHVFNNELKTILDSNTANLMQNAKNFAYEIRSEAQNAYDYKVNKRIHHSMVPSSSSAIKNTRRNRKVLVNQHNQRAP